MLRCRGCHLTLLWCCLLSWRHFWNLQIKYQRTLLLLYHFIFCNSNIFSYLRFEVSGLVQQVHPPEAASLLHGGVEPGPPQLPAPRHGVLPPRHGGDEAEHTWRRVAAHLSHCARHLPVQAAHPGTHGPQQQPRVRPRPAPRARPAPAHCSLLSPCPSQCCIVEFTKVSSLHHNQCLFISIFDAMYRYITINAL